MTAEEVGLTFDREFDVSPAIVWDALVDADLVVGWLADADVEPWLGGCYDLVWLTSDSFPPTQGRITALRDGELLRIETDNRGDIEFRLDAVDGGPRGTRTRLGVCVRVVLEPAFFARVRADWQSNLDQLAGLLRGRPVDWRHWDRDHADTWQGYLRQAAGR